MDMTLAELQEMAARQQQQIEAQQQLLASKVCKECKMKGKMRSDTEMGLYRGYKRGIGGDESKSQRDK